MKEHKETVGEEEGRKVDPSLRGHCRIAILTVSTFLLSTPAVLIISGQEALSKGISFRWTTGAIQIGQRLLGGGLQVLQERVEDAPRGLQLVASHESGLTASKSVEQQASVGIGRIHIGVSGTERQRGKWDTRGSRGQWTKSIAPLVIGEVEFALLHAREETRLLHIDLTTSE
jgi:hypothetical protein